VKVLFIGTPVSSTILYKCSTIYEKVTQGGKTAHRLKKGDKKMTKSLGE